MKYLSWFLGLIAIVIIVIIGAILLRNVFRGSTANSAAPVRSTMLADHIDDGTVIRLRVDGPVVAEEEHQSATVDVSATDRVVTFYRGYDKGEVIRHQSYGNNKEAFRAFAFALDRLGFTAENTAANEHRGECADGRVYHMELVREAKTTKSLWATSCNDRGSFAGYREAVTSLFQNQIPDFQTATDGTIFDQ